jgi:hypothetical protein
MKTKPNWDAIVNWLILATILLIILADIFCVPEMVP